MYFRAASSEAEGTAAHGCSSHCSGGVWNSRVGIAELYRPSLNLSPASGLNLSWAAVKARQHLWHGLNANWIRVCELTPSFQM